MLSIYKYKHLLILMLLAFSGNPMVTHVLGKYAPIIGLILTLVFSIKRRIIYPSFKIKLLWIICGVALISLLQYFELKFIAIEGVINLCIKIIFGGLIIQYLKDEFAKIYFNVLSFLCISSLIFFFLITVLGISIPYVNINNQFQSFFLYTVPFTGTTQNAGMFWEPGAFAGIITLGLILNFNRFGYLLKNERTKFIAIILALLTTQSTTGYLVGFIIAIFYILVHQNILLSIFSIPVVIFCGFFIYQNTEFLKLKIEYQFEKSSDQTVGEFSNTRFGSVIFDWYYIKKHPLIGNGLNKKTRYADHQFLFADRDEDAVRSGNGFSHYLASMGIIFIGGYFFFLWKATRVISRRYSILFLIIILLNLQGEQWLNFPLHLGLPFLIMSANPLKNRVSTEQTIPAAI